MTTHNFTVLLESGKQGGYSAYCPALPGCRAYGDTKKEAIENIKISISYRLESLIAGGKPIPTDREFARQTSRRGAQPEGRPGIPGDI